MEKCKFRKKGEIHGYDDCIGVIYRADYLAY